MIYLFVIILLLCLSLRYDINGKTKYRNEWYYIMFAIFVLIAGLRYRIGIDTIGYIYTYYHNTPLLSNFLDRDYTFAQYPLWKLINSFFYTIGAPFYFVQLFTAAFVNGLLFVYIRKHINYIFTCLFFYFAFFYNTVNFETMKASYAIAIFLFANDSFIEQKKIKGLLLCFLAILFHPSTIALLVVPFLLFLRFNLLGISLLIIAFVGGFVVQKNLGDYFLLFDLFENDAISDKLEGYADSDTYSQTKGFSYIARNTVVIIASFISIKYASKFNSNTRLLVLEPFLMIAMLFNVFSFNIYLFYRFYQFFFIYVCLFLSQLFVYTIRSSKFPNLLSFTRMMFLFIPIYICLGWKYRSSYRRYFPYASVIEKNLNKEREKEYIRLRDERIARFDEY